MVRSVIKTLTSLPRALEDINVAQHDALDPPVFSEVGVSLKKIKWAAGCVHFQLWLHVGFPT